MRLASGSQFRKPIEYVYNSQRNVNESVFFFFESSTASFLSVYFQEALILLVTQVAENSLKLKLCSEALLSGRKYMVVENAQTQTSQRS